MKKIKQQICSGGHPETQDDHGKMNFLEVVQEARP